MKYIVRGLCYLMIPVIVSGVLAFLKRPKKAEAEKVYLPKFFLLLGLIASVLFLVPAVITVSLDESLWIVSMVFLMFSLLSASLMVAFINCRVSYDDEGFIAKNFFGIKRRFTYDQVTGIREGMHEDHIYVGTRKVTIDAFSVGGKEFLDHVKKKYRTIHDGRALPKIHKAKYDIFNGNVHDTTGFVVVFVMISVLIIALEVFFVWQVYFSASSADNTVERQVTFASCVVRDDEIALRSSENQLYKIRFVGEGFRAEAIEAICDGTTVVTAYSDEVTPDDGEDYFSVKAIRKDGVDLLSFEETNRWYKEEYWPLVIVPVVLAILWGGCIAGTIIVGRNPKKFSKRVVRLFFKDGYIKT